MNATGGNTTGGKDVDVEYSDDVLLMWTEFKIHEETFLLNYLLLYSLMYIFIFRAFVVVVFHCQETPIHTHLHRDIAYRSFSLPNFCLPGSVNFIFPKFLQSSMVECVLSCELIFLLLVGLHFV